MAAPKSVTRVNKNGVTYISSVERAQYTIKELTRAALRDSAKYIRNEMKRICPVHKKVLKNNIATWVKSSRTGLPTLIVGVYSPKTSLKKGKTPAWHQHLVEFGSRKMEAQPFVKPGTQKNIQKIREIQSQYISGITMMNEKEIDKLGEGEVEEIADD